MIPVLEETADRRMEKNIEKTADKRKEVRYNGCRTMIPEHGEQLTKKTAESAEKSAETQEALLSERQKQILACMELEVLYKTEEIAEKIGLKVPRTRQLLNELVAMGRLTHSSD